MNEKIIYGFHPVKEALLTGRKPEKIFLKKVPKTRQPHKLSAWHVQRAFLYNTYRKKNCTNYRPEETIKVLLLVFPGWNT